MKYLILLLGLVSSSLAASCPAITTPVQLPSLDPVEFGYLVQISVEDKNLTLDAFEYYDIQNDTFYRGIGEALDVNGTSIDRKMIVYDYPYNQTFVLEVANGSASCMVQDLNSSLPHPPSIFGVGVEIDPLMVQQAFHWNGSYNATLVGPEEMNGIQTNHYNTCIDFDDSNLTYFIDVYYSQDTWTMPAGQNVPVLLRLNAVDNNNVSRVYTYNFFDYRPSTSHMGPHPYRKSGFMKPHKPGEIICRGRKDVPPLPYGNVTKLQFKTQIRFDVNGSNVIFDAATFFDYDNNLTKVESARTTRIDDFNQGLTYIINGTTGQCSVTPIPLQSSYIVDVHNTTVSLRKFENPRTQFNLTYGGQAYYKNILCDVWIAQTPISHFYDRLHHTDNASFYLNYYFTADKWNKYNPLVGMKDIVVTNVSGTEYRSEFYSDVYEETFEVYAEEFDISNCFDQTMQQTVIIQFNSQDSSEIQSHLLQFQRALVAAVADKAGIPTLRVKYAGMSHNSSMYVWVTLFDVANVTGDVSEIIPQADLSTALTSLQTVVASNEFTFQFMGSKMNELTAYPSYWELASDVVVPKQPPSPQPGPGPAPASSGYSGGILAGVAVAMLVAGIGIGFIVYHCRYGRTRSQYAYTMQT